MPTYGIIGNPVSHSLSPLLHGMLYEAVGYDGSYARFPVGQNEIANVIPAMKTLGIAGINITSPYKEKMLAYMDEVSAEAREIGAVNTAHIGADGVVTGYNTDAYGIAQSLLYAGIEIKGKSFAICGTGGGGKAARHALREYGADEIVMVSRNAENGITYGELENLPNMDAIINCTLLGMSPRLDESPVEPHVFAKFKAAADMIYNPVETKFLRDAKHGGLKTLNGLPMLVFQGIRSFEIWTGILTPPGVDEKIIKRLSQVTLAF